MSLNNTPRSSRLHIGIFGRRNSGKSTLINAITNREVAIVSDIAGTTADPVYKSMEISGIGACVLIDTAGFDDEGSLGNLRVEKTRRACEACDIAIIVFTNQDDFETEKEWFDIFKRKKTPVLAILNKSDMLDEKEIATSVKRIKSEFNLTPIATSAKEKLGIKAVITALLRLVPDDFGDRTILGDLVKENDVVLLVMPQDIQAPKGRLILPQVQTLRELLDRKTLPFSCTGDKIDEALNALSSPPALIITDSQIYRKVFDKKPPESKLTSFSTLFAAYKGDLDYYIKGAYAIDCLNETSRVLISEACAHVPLKEDIGREKLPRMLRAKVGQSLSVDVRCGTDFPDDLTSYDLIIQCGACMFNRKYVLSRIEEAKNQNVPMTNYGVAIAKLSGMEIASDALANANDNDLECNKEGDK
ncbi:MAG: [FeFe] hydrogenase H-cluster maturation GTPase HydF [Clostridiales bacterium]|jgi:[FeFe] hydrogenase H-cluster maturation GTPase HydF|nr:[FeFe] hydrogenase H-cluster maturation GTPase HydF [Clostridiales bacterium]